MSDDGQAPSMAPRVYEFINLCKQKSARGLTRAERAGLSDLLKVLGDLLFDARRGDREDRTHAAVQVREQKLRRIVLQKKEGRVHLKRMRQRDQVTR